MPVPQLNSHELREWLGSVQALHQRFDAYVEGAQAELQQKLDDRKGLRVLHEGEHVMLDQPKALKGTSATLSPSFKGPYVVTTKKSDKQVRLGTVAGGPPLTEFSWVSVDRLVAYPWPVGRDAVLDESPLEGWT